MKKFLSIFALVLALSMVLCAAAMAEDASEPHTGGGTSYVNPTEKHGQEYDQATLDSNAENGVTGFFASNPNDCSKYDTVIYTWPCTQGGENHRMELPTTHEWSSESGTLKWGLTSKGDGKEPTCTEAGQAIDYCLKCKKLGSKYRTIEALGHDFSDTSDANVAITKVPDCRNKGTGAYKCVNGCGALSTPDTKTDKDAAKKYPYTVTIADFTGKWLPAQNAATQKKYKDYDPNGHDWDGWFIEKKPTCAADGYKTRFCKVCAATQTDGDATKEGNEDIKQLTDKYEAADLRLIDCFSAVEILRCANCGSTLKDSSGNIIHPEKDGKTVKVSAHEKDTNLDHAIVFDPVEDLRDCDREGYIFYACTHMSDKNGYPDNAAIEAHMTNKDFIDLGHTDDDGEWDPTGVFMEKIPAPGHKWGEWKLLTAPGAGDNEYGNWIRTCSACKKTESLVSKVGPDGQPVEEPTKPELDKSKLDEGIVTVKGLTEDQLKAGVYARITTRYIDANGEGIMIVSSAKVDSEGNFEMPANTVPKSWTLDFRSVIITDTAAPANKMPSDVNKIISSTAL